MARLAVAEAFVSRARETSTQDQLYDILAQSCADMRIRYFALLHHVDFATVGADAIRLHNYPDTWQGWFDENGLGVSDPILRASHHSSIGFLWTEVPRMIQMTPSDRSVFSQARIVGIGDGFTVPAHVPGEINGSCSFAVEAGRAFPDRWQAIAQLIGGFAFEAARRISHTRGISTDGRARLTERQIDCVLWAARGKTDWVDLSDPRDQSRDSDSTPQNGARAVWGSETRYARRARTIRRTDQLLGHPAILDPQARFCKSGKLATASGFTK